MAKDIYDVKIPREYLLGVESDDMTGSFITFTYTDESGKNSRQVTGLVYDANRFCETLNLITPENIMDNDAEVEFYYNRMSYTRFTTPAETLAICENLAKKYNQVFPDSHVAKDVRKYAESEDKESIRKEVLEVLKKHNWTEEDLWGVYSEVAEKEDW